MNICEKDTLANETWVFVDILKQKIQFRARKNARAIFSKLNTIWNDNRHTGSEDFHSKTDVCIIIYLEFILQIEYIL